MSAGSAARAPVIPLLVLHDAVAEEGLYFALRWSTNYRIAARYLGERRAAVEAGVRAGRRHDGAVKGGGANDR